MYWNFKVIGKGLHAFENHKQGNIFNLAIVENRDTTNECIAGKKNGY